MYCIHVCCFILKTYRKRDKLGYSQIDRGFSCLDPLQYQGLYALYKIKSLYLSNYKLMKLLHWCHNRTPVGFLLSILLIQLRGRAGEGGQEG